jgi:hypothetical protein
MTITRKNKDKITFEKRQFHNASLSKMMPSLLRKVGGASSKSKSHTSIIRIVTNWPDIVGQDIANSSEPLKVIYKKQKNRENGELDTVISLRIRAEGALGTIIAMRQAIIVDRLNRLCGTDKFTAISIEHGTVTKIKKSPIAKPTKIFELNLPEIDDPVLKSRLESLGQAVMNSVNK